jgi:hypothetical protein
MGQMINGIDAATLARIVQTVEKRINLNGDKPAASPTPSQNTPPPVQHANDEPREQPAKTISCGDVVTRIWANKTQFGEIVWRIDQRRTRTDGVGGPVCKTLQVQHLQDAIRGLYKASVWIKKTERRLRWRRLWA